MLVAKRTGFRLLAPRSRAVALIVGSRLLLAGGLTAGDATTDRIESIDPRTGVSEAVGRLAVAVHDAGGASLAGVGYVFGGGRTGPRAVVQRIDPRGDGVAVGDLPATRADLAAVTVGGEIIIVGGGTGGQPDARVLATTDGHRFRAVATLRLAVRYPAVVSLGNLVLVFGGATRTGDVRTIQLIDPAAGTVRIVGRLPHGLSHASAFVLGGSVIIAGGRRGGHAQEDLLRYEPASGAVTAVGRLPYPVSDAAVAVLDGAAYLLGGEMNGPIASVIAVTEP